MYKSKKETDKAKPKKEDKPTADQTIKIPHHRSPQFTSQHATGAILSGPTPDGMHHFIFYADSVRLVSETGKLKSQEDAGENAIIAEYTPVVMPDDTETFREDKARISVTKDCLLAIRDLLNRVHPPEKPVHSDE